jgi:hypothetical protein
MMANRTAVLEAETIVRDRARSQLRARWEARDERYARRYSARFRASPFVDRALIAGVRWWRAGEARALEDPELEAEALDWTPAAFLR